MSPRKNPRTGAARDHSQTDPEKSLHVFLSFAPEDKDVASEVAEQLRVCGLKPTLADDMEVGANWADYVKTSIDRSVGSLVLLSSATAHPSSSLSTEWTSILQKTWRDPRYHVVSVKLDPKLDTPAFLRASQTIVKGSSKKAFAEIVKNIAANMQSFDEPPKLAISDEDRARIFERFHEIRSEIASSGESAAE